MMERAPRPDLRLNVSTCIEKHIPPFSVSYCEPRKYADDQITSSGMRTDKYCIMVDLCPKIRKEDVRNYVCYLIYSIIYCQLPKRVTQVVNIELLSI